MARRWLLTMLTGTALSLGLAGSASAQELPGDPVVVEAEVVTATVTADTAERTLEVAVETDVVVEEAETEVSPTVTAEVAPEGPSADVEGPVTVGGTELPVPEAVAPVEEVVDEPAVEGPPTQDQAAAGSGVTAAPAPASAGPAPADDGRTTRHSSTMTADSAAYRTAYRSAFRSGTTAMVFDDADLLAPEIAPPAEALPLVAAAAPTVATDLSLPILDTVPTVPALLRLLAGLMVVGAAATWRTVRNELA